MNTPNSLRRTKFHNSENDRVLVLTKKMDNKASEIAFLYRKRWEVELFFKRMERHLKIKAFWGTSLNAVKILMYCAVISYCLAALVSFKLKVDRSIYEILQILNFSLLDKAPLKEILTKCDYNNFKELKNKQLIICGVLSAH